MKADIHQVDIVLPKHSMGKVLRAQIIMMNAPPSTGRQLIYFMELKIMLSVISMICFLVQKHQLQQSEDHVPDSYFYYPHIIFIVMDIGLACLTTTLALFHTASTYFINPLRWYLFFDFLVSYVMAVLYLCNNENSGPFVPFLGKDHLVFFIGMALSMGFKFYMVHFVLSILTHSQPWLNFIAMKSDKKNKVVASLEYDEPKEMEMSTPQKVIFEEETEEEEEDEAEEEEEGNEESVLEGNEESEQEEEEEEDEEEEGNEESVLEESEQEGNEESEQEGNEESEQEEENKEQEGNEGDGHFGETSEYFEMQLHDYITGTPPTAPRRRRRRSSLN